MTKVFVVTGNGWPAAVCSTQKLADAFCDAKRKAASKSGPDITWAVKPFTVDKKP